MTEKQGILIGNYNKIKYHPLKGVDAELTAVFQHYLDLTCTEQLDILKFDQITRYSLCISYMDCWDYRIPREQIAGILTFVCNGGGLLVIHSGISLQNHNDFVQMLGARFTVHPDMEVLEFTYPQPDHPIVEGLNRFSVYEEPYQFIFNPLSEKQLLLEYEYRGQKAPAAWALEFGLGRVVYLMIGHTRDSFMNPIYREIIFRSGKWCVKDL